MKKYFTLLLLWSGFASLLPAQSLSFTRTYGGNFYDDARSIAATPDGGFVFTGLNKSDIDPDGSMYLTKVNAAGAVLWTKYYLRPEEDGGNHVLQTSDGGFLITGHTALSYGVNCDGFLVKTDARGEEQWRVLVGAAYDDVCDAAVELPDGSFLIAGRMEGAESRTFRMLLAKVASNGRVLFQKTMPTAAPSVAYTMAQSADGQAFLAGYSYTLDGQPDKMLVVKCSPDGEMLWERSFGAETDQRASSVVPNADGGCFIAGGTLDASDQYVSMVACRYDAAGNLLRSAQVLNDAGAGYLYSAAAAPGGGLAVAGVLRQPGESTARPCFALLDNDLNLLHWQTVLLPVDCRTRAIAPNPAGGFIIGGNEYLGNDQADIFLATLRGPDSALDTKAVDAAPYLLFPNPFTDFTYLKTGEPGQPKTLTLSATDGRVLHRVVFEENEYFLQRGDLPAGTYLLSVQLENGTSVLNKKVQAY